MSAHGEARFQPSQLRSRRTGLVLLLLAERRTAGGPANTRQAKQGWPVRSCRHRQTSPRFPSGPISTRAWAFPYRIAVRSLATARPRANGTVAKPIIRKPKTRPRIDQSAPGQCDPIPSPTQKVPKAESNTPTANFSVFSGTLASGRCSARPSATTANNAASAPTLAGSSKPLPPAPIATMTRQ